MKAFILAAGLLAATAATAQDLPKTSLKIVGGLSNLTAYQDYEQPFWTKTIPEKSKGQITAEIKGFNMGGCMGCHGVAQNKGYSFSFVLFNGQRGADVDTQTDFTTSPVSR